MRRTNIVSVQLQHQPSIGTNLRDCLATIFEPYKKTSINKYLIRIILSLPLKFPSVDTPSMQQANQYHIYDSF